MKHLAAILCTAMLCATAIYCAHNWPGRFEVTPGGVYILDTQTGEQIKR